MSTAPSNPPPVNVGEVIVELKKLKKKYWDAAKERQRLRESLVNQPPGKYKEYRIVNVKEVRVKAHKRCAHKRLLLL